MFSGIVEAQSKVLNFTSLKNSYRIVVSRPRSFNDLKIGDSIATNGVCLTVEALTSKTIQFCLGSETVKILGQQIFHWKKYPLNLERSMQFGQRVHGHLVTGHVDTIATIKKSFTDGDCWQLQIEMPKSLPLFFWKKGSVCLNGVSLTVNEFKITTQKYIMEVCLIPETIKATNLTSYKAKEMLNVEADYLAKAYIQSRQKEIS